jgi:hypothetical protein
MPAKRSRLPPAYADVVAQDPEGYYKWNMDQARKGNDGAARELLDGFCCAVQEGKPIPRPIVDFLFRGLIRYLDEDVPLEKALHLNRPKHRPRGVVTVDPVRAVATVYLLMKRDELPKGRALEATCRRLGVSRRNLERFDSRLKLIRDFDVAELETMSQAVAKSARSAKK